MEHCGKALWRGHADLQKMTGLLLTAFLQFLVEGGAHSREAHLRRTCIRLQWDAMQTQHHVGTVWVASPYEWHPVGRSESGGAGVGASRRVGHRSRHLAFALALAM